MRIICKFNTKYSLTSQQNSDERFILIGFAENYFFKIKKRHFIVKSTHINSK